MAVNWNSGVMRWQPHGMQHPDFQDAHSPLNHLHPFRFNLDLEKTRSSPARSAMIHVGFGLHTFTRKARAGDSPLAFYTDERETNRVFDNDRYILSHRLPGLIRSWPLGSPPCSKATEGDNFVSVDLGGGIRYAVFFNAKRWRNLGGNAVLLVVQSAYELDACKADPGAGKYSFSNIIGKALNQPKTDGGPVVTKSFKKFLAEQEAAAASLSAQESENPA